MKSLTAMRGLPLLAICSVTVACSGTAPAAERASQVATMTKPQVVVLDYGKPLALPQAGLTLTMTAVQDTRCPVEVQCIWAGHASVTLQVTAGGQRGEVLIGTPAPPAMNLPRDASLGGYRYTLVDLLPRPSQLARWAPERYQARVSVEPDTAPLP